MDNLTEDLFHALIAAIPDIIMQVDENKVYTWANEAGFRFFGDDVIGRKADYYFEGEQDTYDTVKPLFNGCDDIIYVESWQRRIDGQKRLLTWWCRVLKNSDGHVIGALSTARDVTEEREAQEALRTSKTLFHDLVETAQDLIWQCDAEGRYTYLNPAWEEVFGYTIKEMLGKKFTDFQTPEWAERDLKEFARLLKGNMVKGLETVHVGKDGREINLVFNAKNVQDENGKIAGTRGTAFDITEWKKSEAALNHSHNLMRYIIEHMRSDVAVHDRDLKYVYVSQRYLKDYKVKESDVIGKHHYDVFPDLPQKWRDVHQKALAGEVLRAEDDPYVREDGSVDWTRWECRPWYEADGSIGGIIVYTEIITERKQVEKELEEHRLHLEKMVRERTTELEEKNKQLERFNKLFVGREFRIKELRDQVKELKQRLGEI